MMTLDLNDPVILGGLGVVALIVLLLVLVLRAAGRSAQATVPLMAQLAALGQRVQSLSDGQQQLSGGLHHVSEAQAVSQTKMIALMEQRLAQVNQQMTESLQGSAVRTARSAYYRIDFLNGELPLDRPRIAFRDVTNQTNTRTTIAALIPPGTSVVHTAPVLVPRKGGVRAEAFLLGVLSSIPFDWASRRWVELHLTFELLNALS